MGMACALEGLTGEAFAALDEVAVLDTCGAATSAFLPSWKAQFGAMGAPTFEEARTESGLWGSTPRLSAVAHMSPQVIGCVWPGGQFKSTASETRRRGAVEKRASRGTLVCFAAAPNTSRARALATDLRH